jgi:hypothetical protein
MGNIPPLGSYNDVTDGGGYDFVRGKRFDRMMMKTCQTASARANA